MCSSTLSLPSLSALSYIKHSIKIEKKATSKWAVPGIVVLKYCFCLFVHSLSCPQKLRVQSPQVVLTPLDGRPASCSFNIYICQQQLWFVIKNLLNWKKKSDSMPERTNLEEFLLSKHRVDMKNDNDTSHGWQTI